jgi:Asp-tRNA(Asn)/Glu-tRNA(Gln) amidotransferase A subunit family amidase
VVRRLREAGAIVIGKTHAPEVGQWHFTETPLHGVTRNPWSTGAQLLGRENDEATRLSLAGSIERAEAGA